MQSRTSLKMGYVGSKTRSLGKILEKPFVHSRGLTFGPILMKRGQNVRKMGHVGSKTRSLSEILEKPCVSSGSHVLGLILMKLSQNVCLNEISGGSYWVKM